MADAVDRKFGWGTVVFATPLSVRKDGSSSPIGVSPDSLVDLNSLAAGERVWCQWYGRRVVILGRASNRAGDFGIENSVAEYVTQLFIPSNRVMQSFSRVPDTGEYIVAQVGGYAGVEGDTVIYRCNKTGFVQDYAVWKSGGHGSSIATERVGTDTYIWEWWSHDPDNQGRQGLKRWKYSGSPTGKIINIGDADVEDVPDFAGGYSNVAIDQVADRIAVREAKGNTGDTLVLYRLSEYKDGYNNPLCHVSIYYNDGHGPFQGFATADNYVYVARGGAGEGPNGETPTLHSYGWDTSNHKVFYTDDVGATRTGYLGGHNEAEGVSIWRDASGAASILFGRVTGSGGQRRATVYGFSSNNSGALSVPTLESVAQRVQAGSVTITPTPNKATQVHVTFPYEFSSTPVVTVTARTTVIGTTVHGVAAGVADTQGVNVLLYRENDTKTKVSWIAVEETPYA